jgi:hypothetical protein
MQTIVTTVEIDASPAKLWSVLTDFDDLPRWNPFIKEVKGRIEKGEHLKVLLSLPGSRVLSFHLRLIRVLAEQELRLYGQLWIPLLFKMEHILEIKPFDRNQALLIHREVFQGLLVPFLWRSYGTRMWQFLIEMNNAIRKHAEQKRDELEYTPETNMRNNECNLQ